jgi:hypothetical protein
MTGRTRLPAGEPRKASQRRIRRAGTSPTRITPQWSNGDKVRWHDKAGVFHRDLGDGNAEITIASRAYRVRIADLGPGVDGRTGLACISGLVRSRCRWRPH